MTSLDGTPSRGTSSPRRTEAVGLLIGPVFLLLAAWFIWGPSPELPSTDAEAVGLDQISTDPMRPLFEDPPIARVGETGQFDQTCMSCHRTMPSPEEAARKLFQHTHIVLDHGLNDRCFNCHDREDRNMLALRGQDKIPYAEVAQLCAKCHGPTYRDWEKGMHGKALGYWDTTQGESTRLTCTECHDPHAPAVAPMLLLPGPRTLRMRPPGEHDDGEHAVESPNPLRRWSRDVKTTGPKKGGG